MSWPHTFADLRADVNGFQTSAIPFHSLDAGRTEIVPRFERKRGNHRDAIGKYVDDFRVVSLQDASVLLDEGYSKGSLHECVAPAPHASGNLKKLWPVVANDDFDMRDAVGEADCPYRGFG